MEQNRRRFLRKVPTDPAFIQIERDEVGKVLNVSEGGLSFSSVTPVPRNLPVYFWFSFNLKDRIEAMRSEEHTSELQSRLHLVCRLLLEKKKKYDVLWSLQNASTHICIRLLL